MSISPANEPRRPRHVADTQPMAANILPRIPNQIRTNAEDLARYERLANTWRTVSINAVLGMGTLGAIAVNLHPGFDVVSAARSGLLYAIIFAPYLPGAVATTIMLRYVRAHGRAARLGRLLTKPNA